MNQENRCAICGRWFRCSGRRNLKLLRKGNSCCSTVSWPRSTHDIFAELAPSMGRSGSDQVITLVDPLFGEGNSSPKNLCAGSLIRTSRSCCASPYQGVNIVGRSISLAGVRERSCGDLETSDVRESEDDGHRGGGGWCVGRGGNQFGRSGTDGSGAEIGTVCLQRGCLRHAEHAVPPHRVDGQRMVVRWGV